MAAADEDTKINLYNTYKVYDVEAQGNLVCDLNALDAKAKVTEKGYQYDVFNTAANESIFVLLCQTRINFALFFQIILNDFFHGLLLRYDFHFCFFVCVRTVTELCSFITDFFKFFKQIFSACNPLSVFHSLNTYTTTVIIRDVTHWM